MLKLKDMVDYRNPPITHKELLHLCARVVSEEIGIPWNTLELASRLCKKLSYEEIEKELYAEAIQSSSSADELHKLAMFIKESY